MALWACVAASVATVGCGPALTAMYLMGWNDAKAEYAGLREKRVVVVCRPVVTAQYQNPSVAKNIARRIGSLLKKNIGKIEVVDYRKVAEWVDNNTWDEYYEIGDALDADMIVGIDLESFSIFQGQTLYQGKANCTIKVFDCKSEDTEPVYEKIMPPVIYPPNTGIPTSDKQEAQFRNDFIRKLAEHIARHFYNHDPHTDFAYDSTAFD